MIAPAEGHVGEAMDEEDGAVVWGGGGAGHVDVAVGAGVEVRGFEGDAGVVEREEFVDGHGEGGWWVDWEGKER